MNVRQLIEHLQNLDQELIVTTMGHDWDNWSVKELEDDDITVFDKSKAVHLEAYGDFVVLQ